MEDDTVSKKSDASVSSDKTLSKSTLYAPLTAYASGSFRVPKRVAKSHSEAHLVDWLHRLSADYHQSCQPGDPRNTGNRFLSTHDLQDKIMHRTLSLFGKGYGAKLGRTTSRAPPSATKRNAKHKKPKRTSKNAVILEESSFETTQTFLSNLNRLWTHYMFKVLDRRGVVVTTGEDSEESTLLLVQQASRAIYECAHAMEWVGAWVRIERCHAFESWKGREGVVVTTTKNTWVIVERISDSERFRRLVVPKKDSNVTVLLQLSSDSAHPTDTNNDKSNLPTLRISLSIDSIPT